MEGTRRLSLPGSQGHLEPAGKGDVEGTEGLVPVLDLGAFDEAGWCFAGLVRQAGFLGAFPGAYVLDVADRQPQEFGHGVVVREVAPVLDDLAELIVQRLHTVGGVDDPAQRRRELQKRDEPLRATRGRTCQVAESMGGCW